MQKIMRPIQYSIMLFSLTFMIVIFSNCSKTATSTTTIVGDWARKGSFDGPARTQATSFTIGDSVYITGGFNGTTRLNDLWVYNSNTNSWLRRTAFPGTPRSNAVGFSANGKGYIATGFDGVNMLGDCWQYDPATTKWTKMADFANAALGSTARYGAAAFSINNMGYVGTGFDGNYQKDFYQYNPATNTWSQIASFGGEKRMNSTTFVHNNIAYLVTGVNNGIYPADFWKYNPTTGAWSQLRQIASVSADAYDDLYGNNLQRSDASSFIMNNFAYLVFGNRSGIVGTCWEYDLTNDVWSQKTSFEGSPRQNSIGFSVKNQGYIITGGNTTGLSVNDDCWAFYPTLAVDANNNY